jgi:hypothetical protein
MAIIRRTLARRKLHSTTILNTTLSRSDSLHQLELDKARVKLEREQKALAFERNTSARPSILKQELHQRKLALLDATACQ